MDGRGVDVLDAVVGPLHAVVGTQLQFQALRTEGDGGRFGKHQRSRAVEQAVVVAGLMVVEHKGIIVERPCFITAEGLREHVHGPDVPYAADVFVVGGAAAALGVVVRSRHNAVLHYLCVGHAHDRALALRREFLEAQTNIVGEGGLQGRISVNHIERIRKIGHRLQLRHRGLGGATHIHKVHRRLLVELVAQTHERSEIPYPALGYILLVAREVFALRHRRNGRHTEIQVILGFHEFESEANVLSEKIVAETVGELVHVLPGEECEIHRVVGAVGEIGIAAFNALVGVVPAVLQAVAEGEEAAFGYVAERFGPAQTRTDGVGPRMAVGILLVGVD